MTGWQDHSQNQPHRNGWESPDWRADAENAETVFPPDGWPDLVTADSAQTAIRRLATGVQRRSCERRVGFLQKSVPAW